jgi:hypothetical protein
MGCKKIDSVDFAYLLSAGDILFRHHKLAAVSDIHFAA